MRKLLGLFVLFLTLNSCDDGDVTVQNISFENVTAANCGDILYKINGNEAFLIIIPASELAYKNEVTTKIKTITGNIKVIYRNYSGTPSSSNFCNLPAAASPSVVEEWNAIGGTIEIKTTGVKTDPNSTTQATRINKYNHYIVFKNIIFQKPSGTQRYDNFIFGNYQTNTTLLFPSSGSQSFSGCSMTAPSQTRIYVNNNLESLSLDNLDTALFINTPNTTPIVRNLGATSHVLTIKTYNGTIPSTFYCGASIPANPVVQDTWSATSGTIEVTTTTSSGTYTHSIKLKNVTITKSGLYPENFYLGNEYDLGTFVR